MEQIWDPLRRKNVTATPEERVRQWFILQLRQSFDVPVTMMNSEVGFLFGGKRYRADIIIYDRSGAPVAVVECKRPDVSITEEVATQAMQYNSVLKVKYLILTNGKMTYIYTLKDGVFALCDHIPLYEEMICQQ